MANLRGGGARCAYFFPMMNMKDRIKHFLVAILFLSIFKVLVTMVNYQG